MPTPGHEISARKAPVISSWMMIRGENEERNPGLPVLPVNPSRLLVVNASKINSHPTSLSMYATSIQRHNDNPPVSGSETHCNRETAAHAVNALWDRPSTERSIPGQPASEDR